MLFVCGPNGVIVYVYPAVPPDATTVAVPSFKPLHDGWVNDELLNANIVGCVTTTTDVPVQPFAVVAVTVYCCAVKFEKIPVVFD